MYASEWNKQQVGWYDGGRMLQMLSSLRLTTLTVIGREEEKKLSQMLLYLMELPDSAEFVNPVDWQELELHDYPLVVKHPMHLTKVQDRLKAREYRTVEEVLDHIQLIWDNCKAYNPEGHYFVMADKMERNFKKMIRNYLPSIQVVVPKPVTTSSLPIPPPPPPPPVQKQAPPKAPSRVPQIHYVPQPPPPQPASFADESEISGDEISLSEKNRLQQRLKQITQQELGSLIYLIQENCSQGYKDLGAGRGQIHLDNLDLETFRKVNSKLDEMLDSEKLQGNKKIKI